MDLGLGPAALLVALAGAVAALGLSVRGRETAAARGLAVAFAGLTVALVVLARALITVDGSLVYVADHTSRATRWPYRLAGLWGGMAGSLLLWTWVAAVWALVAWRVVRRRVPELARGLGAIAATYLAVGCGLLVLVSQPFDRLAVPAVDGGGLNPVLLHPAMLYHPPLLYAGAVGLLIPFALAVTGLGRGRGWLPLAIRFGGLSLLLLSAGLLSGAHWAYVELGWGGYWAWDPVENGGLLPWLAGVAFLHAGLVDPRRSGAPDRPNRPAVAAAALACLAFVLGLLGAFLTRSGATDSVHDFAEARVVGWVLGAGLAVAVSGAGARLWRHRRGMSAGGVIAANNLLLVALIAVIGVGTVFPTLARWVTGDRVVVTGHYYALVTTPLVVVLLVLLGVGPRLGRTMWPAVAGIVGAAVAGLVWSRPVAILLIGLAVAAAALTVAEWRRRPRARWPLAHLGVAVLLAGVAGTTTGTHETATLSPDQEVEVAGYSLRLERVVPVPVIDGGRAAAAELTVDGRPMRPVALVSATGQRVSVAALRSTPVRDVQVALRSVNDGGTVVVLEAAVLPLMQLVWWGGLLLVIGLVPLLVSSGGGVRWWGAGERARAPGRASSPEEAEVPQVVPAGPAGPRSAAASGWRPRPTRAGPPG